MQLEEVQAFFRRYYHPANASLAIAGDIDRDAALALARAYFGGHRAGAAGGAGRRRRDRSTSDVRLLLEDRVELPRLYMSWLSPAMFGPEDADLDLAADLLANGKTSRLYRRLVFEERIATDVSAGQNSREIAGFFQVTATAAPGHTLAEIEAVVLEEIVAARRSSARATTRWSAAACRRKRSSSTGCRRSAASAESPISSTPTTCSSAIRGTSSATSQRYETVTPASLQAAVDRHVRRARRMTLSVVPRGRTSLAIPDSSPAVVS